MKEVNLLFAKSMLCFCVLFVSCDKKKNTNNFVAPSPNETYDVISTLVKNEKLDSPILGRKPLIRAVLAKRKVNFKGRWGGCANYVDLIAEKGTFSKADSSFFVYQNSIVNTFTINHGSFDVISETDLKSKKINIWSKPIIRLSIPIFSLDHTIAYVLVDLDYADSGHGEAYIMIKENNRWRVKLKYETWIA